MIVCGTASSRLVDLAVSPVDLMRRGSALKINSVYYITKCINPSLDRVLGLCGADVKSWYQTMRKRKSRVRHINYELCEQQQHEEEMKQRALATRGTGAGGVQGGAQGSAQGGVMEWRGTGMMGGRDAGKFKQRSMDQFTLRGLCECCGGDSVAALCPPCREDPLTTAVSLHASLDRERSADANLAAICRRCSRQSAGQSSTLFLRRGLVGHNCCESMECPTFHDRCKVVLKIEDLVAATSELDQLLHQFKW